MYEDRKELQGCVLIATFKVKAKEMDPGINCEKSRDKKIPTTTKDF